MGHMELLVKKVLEKKTTSTNPKLWCPHSLQLEHKVGPSASEVGLAKFPAILLFWKTLFTISEAGTLVCGLLKQLSSCWGHVGAPLEIQKMLQQNVLQLTVFLTVDDVIYPHFDACWRYFDGHWQSHFSAATSGILARTVDENHTFNFSALKPFFPVQVSEKKGNVGKTCLWPLRLIPCCLGGVPAPALTHTQISLRTWRACNAFFIPKAWSRNWNHIRT